MSLVAETATLVHGYTMADIDNIARRACRATARLALDPSDRWDAAWHGVVELLYSSAERPPVASLINAGCDAIGATGRQNLQAHGVNRTSREQGARFHRYWGNAAANTDEGFADRLVERLALPQVLSVLTPTQYDAIATLAVHGSITAAAEATGVSRSTFTSRIERARRRLLETWYEHETPRRVTLDRDSCKHGHRRDEHGYRNKQHGWNCRICDRNNTRRARARAA